MSRLFAVVLVCAAARMDVGGERVGVRDAVFAGGCFWGMEEAFEHVPGVSAVESGYTGGTVQNPTYEQVGSGRTGHLEAVRVRAIWGPPAR